MIQNEITMLNISAIHVDWDDRRSTDDEHVTTLAESIASTGLIHTIVVEKDSLHLCAGGHRIRAFQLNAKNDVPCAVKAYRSWTRIPARLATNFSPSDLARIELIENLQHRNLSWTEEVLGICKLHRIQKQIDSSWIAEQTADIVGIHRSTVNRIMQVAPSLEAGDETVLACESLGSAYNIVQRRNNREKAEVIEKIMTGGPVGLTPGAIMGTEKPVNETPTETPPAPALPPSPIISDNFNEFAQTYSGPRFNLLHCDFPYGINLDKAQGQGGIKDINKYADNPEVYWQLLSTLAENQHTLLASSCHILFWFSQNLRRETEDFFASHLPAFSVQSHLMIWHQSDNCGLLPDPNRYGRRNYETAFLLTSGDRKLVKAKALSFSHPGKNSNRMHRSEKPLPVVTHFLSMFADENSILLDPTCGSGTALRAAYDLGVRKLTGLEIDKEMCASAGKEFLRHTKEG